MGLLSDIASFGKALVEDAESYAKDAEEVGDFIARAARGGRLTELARFGRKLSEWGRKGYDFFKNSALGRRLVRAARTPIPAAGQKVIEGMRLTTGFGDPVGGEQFGTGAAQFDLVEHTLQSAAPTDAWEGSGSQAYGAQNVQQLTRSVAMGQADRAVATVLTREAAQISGAREVLDGQADWLADISLVTAVTALIPYVGKAAATAAEVAAVTKAVGRSTQELIVLSASVSANAAEIRQSAGVYDSVGAGAASRADTDFGATPRAAGNAAPPAVAAPATGAQTGGDKERGGGSSGSGGGPAGAGGGSAGAGGGGPSGVAAGGFPAPPARPNLPPAPAAPAAAGPAGGGTPMTPGMPVSPTAGGGAGGGLAALIGSMAGALTGVVLTAAQRAEARRAAGDKEDTKAAAETKDTADTAELEGETAGEGNPAGHERDGAAAGQATADVGPVPQHVSAGSAAGTATAVR